MLYFLYEASIFESEAVGFRKLEPHLYEGPHPMDGLLLHNYMNVINDAKFKFNVPQRAVRYALRTSRFSRGGQLLTRKPLHQGYQPLSTQLVPF